MLYHPWSYRITIDESIIPLKRICVLSYLCLRITKVLFETSLKSFQYNTRGRRLSNYLIKLILCSHWRSRYKGLRQNKKHGFDQYTKGGHFCAAHMALSTVSKQPPCVGFVIIRYSRGRGMPLQLVQGRIFNREMNPWVQSSMRTLWCDVYLYNRYTYTLMQWGESDVDPQKFKGVIGTS